MKTRCLIYLCLWISVLGGSLLANDSIEGYWVIRDEDTSAPQTVVAVYEHDSRYYGRIMVTFDNGKLQDSIATPKVKAPGVVGEPYYAGMDIVWDLVKKGEKYVDGNIIDPQQGIIYDAKMWREGENLVLRGEVLFFGKNMIWFPATENLFPPGFQKPELSTLVPRIPQSIHDTE